MPVFNPALIELTFVKTHLNGILREVKWGKRDKIYVLELQDLCTVIYWAD